MPRLTLVALMLGGITAVASGCSGTGGGAALPNSAVAAGSSPLRARFKITQFQDLPQYNGYYGPSAIVSAGGSLWVADIIDQDFGENVIVQIATSGEMTNAYYYSGPTSEGASFQDIAYGPDGALWITDIYDGQVVRMTLQGAYTNYPLKDFNSPYRIVSGPQKSLWFTADGEAGSVIGRLTTTGKTTFYPTQIDALGIAVGSDGALWFTGPKTNAIGRMTTNGKVTEYTKGISSGAEPYSIAAGPDGALWFTELTGGRIGRITTSGSVTEYSQGITAGEEPTGIAAGPDNAMWFTESEQSGSYQINSSKIGRITLGGKIHEYSKGISPQADPTAITSGPDSNMWFVESFIDETGRITL
jgi:streptogramin lyase